MLPAALLNSHVGDCTSPSAAPDVYIVAPHTSQTIPLLHAHLANTLSDSQTAINLLKPVRLLQYFDLAGLAESVAEISEGAYRVTQAQERQHDSSQVRNIVLIQGVGQTISATHRRSGLVQANALLAGLMRNVAQLCRISGDVLVLLECAIEMEVTIDNQPNQDAARSRTVKGIVLDSAFSGPSGESLKLTSSHETLSRTVEAVLDCLIVVHDGLGRLTADKRRNEPQVQVVEVVKDRINDVTGLWDLWKAG